MQVEMFLNGVALVGVGGVEQQKFPEGIHDGQVLGPVDLCDIIKNISDYFVGAHLLIKPVDQDFNIVGICDVVFHSCLLEVAKVSVLFEPALFGFVIGHVLFYQCPETVGVVEFDQVRQFVQNNVVLYVFGRKQQAS